MPPDAPSPLEDLLGRFLARFRRLIIGVVVATIAVALLSGQLSSFFADVLWFRDLGQESVFWRRLQAEFEVGAWGAAIVFVLVWLNLRLAIGLVPKTTIVPVDIAEQQFDAVLHGFNRAFANRSRPIALLVALAAALLLGAPIGAKWQTFLLAANAVPFGVEDPQFGRDVGFFVFTLPALRVIADRLPWILGITLLASAAVHLLGGSIRPWRRLQGFEPFVQAHLSVLLAAILGVKAFAYGLDIWELDFSARGQVLGASYTDVHAQLPALRLLVGIAALSALALLANLHFRAWKLFILAVGIWLVAAVLVGRVYPALVQQFVVAPNEAEAEAPYIKRNIEWTRRAFDLDTVEVKPFDVSAEITPADLAAHRGTIDNARLWDPAVVAQSYKQLQEIRPYYDFNDVDIDRYVLDGVTRQVLVSAREMNVDQLAEQARTWVNQHLVYTHGHGVVVSPASEVSGSGFPRFLVKDIPPTSVPGLEIAEPALYFGESERNYVIVASGLKEFDYPLGDENATRRYDGKAGIVLDSLLRKLAFAVHFRAPQVLLSGYVDDASRVLFRRAVTERVATLAPWLSIDPDPYIAIVDGRLLWILDGYTTTSRYPYSQPLADGTNYIRNSVKVTVDAYDGTTTLWAFDGKDPVLAAWRAIFPGLVVDAAGMSPALRAHLRYPDALFRIQAEVYKNYHMLDPQVFYNKEDSWALPGEKGGAKSTMKPFYVLMRLPGEASERFVVMLPFTPRAKDNLIGWMAAHCDPERYGQRVVFQLPKQTLVLGPDQVSARIHQNPEMSGQLTLWNQHGSKLLWGNLLVLPVAKTIVYLQPLYLQADQTAMPELTRVIVVWGDKMAMEPDLATALEKVFGKPVKSGPPPVPPPLPAPVPVPGPVTLPVTVTVTATLPLEGTPTTGAARQPGSDAKRARSLYLEAIEAQKAGDWARYGDKVKALGVVLEGMAR